MKKAGRWRSTCRSQLEVSGCFCTSNLSKMGLAAVKPCSMPTSFTIQARSADRVHSWHHNSSARSDHDTARRWSRGQLLESHSEGCHLLKNAIHEEKNISCGAPCPCRAGTGGRNVGLASARAPSGPSFCARTLRSNPVTHTVLTHPTHVITHEGCVNTVSGRVLTQGVLKVSTQEVC